MAIYIGAVAGQVLLGYQDLQKLLDGDRGTETNEARVNRYNGDLEFIREWFDKGDQSFLEPIAHLKPLSKTANSWIVSLRIKADGRLLLATAHRFLEMHLLQEDKDEAGFSPPKRTFWNIFK